jgi:hypothetical protein
MSDGTINLEPRRRFRGWRSRTWPVRLRFALLIRGSWKWNALVRDFTAWVDRRGRRRVMAEGTINGKPYRLPDGYVPVPQEQLWRLQRAASLLSDLDRSPSGRHRGDAEYQNPSGFSQGNPLLPPGTHIGHTIGGLRIVVPDRPSDPDAWVEVPDARP